MDLKTLTDEQLIELRKKTEIEVAKSHNTQLAKKIQLNSAYGALSNLYYRWFDPKLAESITLSGQMVIRYMADKINNHFNELLGTDKDWIIAIDTDSLYINMEEFVQHSFRGKQPSKQEVVDFLDDVCENTLEPLIDKYYAELANNMNAYQQMMVMKREVIADKAVWTAKKRYIINVWNNEGVAYTKPVHKMQGIEAVRKTIPQISREYIKGAINVLMNGTQDELINYIEQCREEFSTKSFEEVAFPRGCSDVEKYIDRATMLYTKGCPIHVRASIIYNNEIHKAGLEKKYNKIVSGDKIKFSYLKMPNPTHENVIATPGYLPRELDLEQYIDYEHQFNATVITPLKKILDAAGWPIERKATLSSLFE